MDQDGQLTTSGRVTLTVDGTRMSTYVAKPAGQGPFPAIIFAMHIGGVEEATEEFCTLFAQNGYLTVCPDLYHRQDNGIDF